ncbi:hypothetical protein [Cupriavidus sp. SW-Y-13]|uniref:hypothetical protein n=1 Tax=Cupriavidus sp. SW-Y-13 TaxID=2653854 RepID=UPI0013656876|nr:hypothetical protein [Cupriavidus sp. SW-Y-13]MWL91339.1 hypothetical protein [Cupriavidus sp. SW-Y-13]
MRLGAICLSAAILAGCAGSPARISMMDEAELSQQSNENLCAAYYMGSNKDRVLAELQKRGALNSRDQDNVAGKKIQIGMSSTGLICSWGRPSKINSTTTRYGTREQWVYEISTSKRQYVYVENGLVSAWQN